ncbi:MAG: hypothetical protein WHT06_14045 [Desulfobacterales bacterium]
MDIDWTTTRLSRFFPLFGEGVRIEGPGGAGLPEFLLQAAGIDPDYLARRVQTVFLNGRPVDDLSRAEVRPGDRIALSAALPGLAGAVLRRGSALAAMRRTITWEEAPRGKGAAGLTAATLLLFNLVASERGPDLLARGVSIPAATLSAFVERNFPRGVPPGDTVRIDGRPAGGDPWWRGLSPEGLHRLRVRPAPA